MNILPELVADNVKETVAFYSDVLSFEIKDILPSKEEPTWASMRKGEAEIMIQAKATLKDELPKVFRQECGGTLMLLLKFASREDLDKAVKAANSRACVIKQPVETEYGTVEGAINDPNNYTLILSVEV
jgi:uncharacterized glyoxalase superfamily protein PhnB